MLVSHIDIQYYDGNVRMSKGSPDVADMVAGGGTTRNRSSDSVGVNGKENSHEGGQHNHTTAPSEKTDDHFCPAVNSPIEGMMGTAAPTAAQAAFGAYNDELFVQTTSNPTPAGTNMEHLPRPLNVSHVSWLL